MKIYGKDAKSGDGAYRKLPTEAAFPFLKEKGHVVSLVGGGGKTTILYRLAEHCASKGYRTLISTTTHMQQPEEKLWVHDPAVLEMHWEKQKVAVIGEACEGGKIRQPDAAVLEACMGEADIALIEADGAKGMPCKVPARWEPVILPQSDIVIGVMGLDAVGRPIEDVCFRLKETMELLKAERRHCLTPEDAACILSSERGTRKNAGDREYYVVLNKCDDMERFRTGAQVLELLKERGISGGIMACQDSWLQKQERNHAEINAF